MCGIAGIISKDISMVNQPQLKKMTDIIAHRGPDGEGHWISEDGQVGLGHRRLSIIDLSHEADQPMHYLDRYTIAFNGEIYNYIELKKTLAQQGYSFRTQSDTEVLMALYDKHKEKCLPLLDGMFALVLYDKVTQQIFCARDRFGEKPFFYHYESGKHFYFGSEMKCLWAGGIAKEVNNVMLFNYLSYGLLDNPNDLRETFYQGCTRLPHAHYAYINLQTLELSIHPYYDIDWENIDTNISEKQAREKFQDLFYTSVKRRLRSDVSVGSSLSGGLDSSLVVCIIDELKKGTAQQQNTFSAVFPGFKKDERKYMDYVITKTNVSPHFVTPTDEEMMKDLDKLSYHQEEPYGSASIYVQYRVMQLAKANDVTVLLDGQGADELLAGYHAYFPHYFNELRSSNKKLYKQEIDAYKSLHVGSDINDSVLSGWKNRVKTMLPGASTKLRKFYQQYKQISNPLLNKDFYHTYHKESFERTYAYQSLNHSLYASTLKQNLQELLRYADRNSMAHSREVRLPFLSHELVDFLYSLPPHFKIRDGWTKWIMREAFPILPDEIRWRKDKIGYEPPQQSWMENTQVKERIYTSRKKLIESNILIRSLENDPIIAEQSNKSTSNTWRIWMAGNLMKS